MIMVNETLREQCVEDFELEEGHRWQGPGPGDAAESNSTGWKHGIGILLGKRWPRAVAKVKMVSPRMMYVDL